MSRGVLDQAAFDAATKAAAWAEAHGMRALWEAIHYAPDGSRSFRFKYEPIKRGRKVEPAPVERAADPPPILRRGGVTKPVQEEMSL